MKKYSALLSLLLISGVIYWSFYALMPQNYTKENTPLDKFSTERALVHVREMTQKVHHPGTPAHEEVQEYITKSFETLGLYVEIQEDYIMDRRRRLTAPENILTRIKGTGNGEALLLLAHYDSSMHSSYGASDDASGVATIIESVRAFLESDLKPKNDIIILISDSEETGLIGAQLFVKEHPWAKDVKLVLNFEARGSGGPSYMLIETNGGNANMIKAFKKADVPFPVANSLAYTVYKNLPNDTDLTIFRENADINGFNFAFIDDHFDYHTARDNMANLDKNTLEHQGTYLMPLLHHFAYADLNTVKSMDDDVYFNTPIGLHSYPFMLIFPLLIVAIAVFGFLIYLGFKKRRLAVKPVFIGFLPFIIALVVSAALAHYGWDLLRTIYPQYGEILHGFPYNGYLYITAFIMLTLAICFMSYSFFKAREHMASYFVAPLFIWLLINVFVALYFKGAAFFIVPAYFSLLLFYLTINHEKPNLMVLTLISLPALVIFTPFLQAFPVGLGLKMMAIPAIFTALTFGILLPVFGTYKFKRPMAILFVIAFGFFSIKAHFASNFSEERQKPNSLLYIFNADEHKAWWASYDRILDDWTKRKLGDAPKEASSLEENALPTYRRRFSYIAEAPLKNIPEAKIEISRDTIIGSERHIELCITSQRPVSKMEIYADDSAIITTLTANGEQLEMSKFANGNKKSPVFLFNYYVTDDNYLELSLSIPKGKNLTLEVNEVSFDLLTNTEFNVSQRSKDMIPKPFVLNDAIVIKKTIKL